MSGSSLSHKYGNPKASEAESALAEARERVLSEKRERLMQTHTREVRKAWEKAKPVVKRGDDKAERVLEGVRGSPAKST